MGTRPGRKAARPPPAGAADPRPEGAHSGVWEAARSPGGCSPEAAGNEVRELFSGRGGSLGALPQMSPDVRGLSNLNLPYGKAGITPLRPCDPPILNIPTGVSFSGFFIVQTENCHTDMVFLFSLFLYHFPNHSRNTLIFDSLPLF